MNEKNSCPTFIGTIETLIQHLDGYRNSSRLPSWSVNGWHRHRSRKTVDNLINELKEHLVWIYNRTYGKKPDELAQIMLEIQTAFIRDLYDYFEKHLSSFWSGRRKLKDCDENSVARRIAPTLAYLLDVTEPPNNDYSAMTKSVDALDKLEQTIHQKRGMLNVGSKSNNFQQQPIIEYLHTESITRTIASGSFGQVFVPKSSHVAIKKILKTHGHSDDPKVEMQQEFEATIKCQSPYVVKYLFHFENFMIMHQYQSPLDEILKMGRNSLPNSARKLIITCIINGIKAISDKDYVHHDVKPKNILLDINGQTLERAVITDFGLAKKIGTPLVVGFGTVTHAHWQQMFPTAGTYSATYMDTYAVGQILWELSEHCPAFLFEQIQTIIDMRNSDSVNNHSGLTTTSQSQPIITMMQHCFFGSPIEKIICDANALKNDDFNLFR